MSMTWEEAIRAIEEIRASALKNLGAKHAPGCEGYYRDRIALADACLSALCPVSREQVEKVWRGEWEFYDGGCQCEHCGITTKEDSPFCPGCGRAMWNEAVQMVMERLEALKDEA